jgi:serine/threonine protein kinase
MAGKQVYPATDLYALAVTCISLLTGKPAEQLYDDYNNCWVWRNYVPISDRFAAILDKMLMASPSQRFQSATEVLSLLDPNPVQTTPRVVSNPTPVAPASPAPLAPSTPSSKNRFSLLEILGSAGFTGFEGALLAISLTNLFSVSGVSIGILGATVAGLIYAQTRRIIEKIDLGIIAGITTAIILFIPALQGQFAIGTILIIAAMSGATAIAITALFKLIYQILVRIL